MSILLSVIKILCRELDPCGVLIYLEYLYISVENENIQER